MCWKDLPVERIKSESTSEHGSDTEDITDEVVKHPNNFAEVFACVPLSKPVEKILIRYEKMPEDFCSVLGFFPNRSESPSPGLRNNESLQRHRSRNANAAFLTLSRYISHQRWIWTIQNCPSVSLSGLYDLTIKKDFC